MDLMRAQLRRVSHSQDNKRIDFKAVGRTPTAVVRRLPSVVRSPIRANLRSLRETLSP